MGRHNKYKDCVDRISDLPEHLQHVLLSYLPMEDAVRTSMLSKHWNSTWKSFPILDFNHHTYLLLTDWRYSFQQFLEYVDTSVLCHRHHGSSLVKFRIAVCFIYGKELASKLDGWLNYALENNVKELVIDQYDFNWVRDGEKDACRYVMPQAIFSAKSIQNLDLSGCRIINNNALRSGLGLGLGMGSSLRKLKLSNVYINQETLENLFSNSSVLEDVSMSWCEGFEVVRLRSTNLTSAYLNCFQSQIVRMETPNLESLSYRGSFDNLKGILMATQNLKKLKLSHMKFNTCHQYFYVTKKFPAVEIDNYCIISPQPI